MAPLSGKQQREYLKFQNKEARESAKMEVDEFRKQQLHELKLQEAAAKAKQGLGYKEQVNNAKLKDMGIPPARMNKQKLGIPTQNPLAGTGMFKQGQRSLAQAPMFQAKGTDTVPAMLTPGEAVIPRAAAQNPKNKKAIKRMVQEGRKANMRDGAVDVRNSDAPMYNADGISSVPSLAYRHPDVPGSSFMHGTMSVPDFSRGSSAQANYANGSYGVVPQQVQSAVGYENGDTNVSYMDRFLNFIAGQDPTKQPVVAPLAQPTNQPSDFNTIIERVFQREYPSEDKAYHNVKGDRGGPTKYGISQKAYPKLDIKNLTKEQAIEIAKRDYWDKNKVDQLDPALREVYFDTAFNKGSGAAKLLLERSGGDPAKFLDERQKYANEIVKKDPSQKKFQQGWSNRINDLKKVAETATDVIIPSAQASTLDAREPQAPLSAPVTVVKPEVAVNTSAPSGRDVLIAKQNLATTTDPKLVQSSKDVLARANQAVPTLADTRGAIINSPLTAMETPLFNKDQQDLIRLSEIINDPDTTPNDKKWAYTEINRITRNGQPVSPVGVGTARSISNRVLGSETQANIANLPKNEPYPDKEVPPPVVVEPPYIMQGEGIKPGGSLEGLNADKSGVGFKTKDTEEAFNKLGIFSGNVYPDVQEAVNKVKAMPIGEKEKEGVLSKMLSGLFGKSGLFGDQELIRFALLAAGGMLTGGSVGGSLKFAGLNTLQSADRNQATKQAALAEASKNQRELSESLQKEYRTLLAGNIPADIKSKALKYMEENPAKTHQEDVSRHRAVLQYLAQNTQQKDANVDKYSDFKPGYIGNNPVEYVVVKDSKGVPQKMLVSQNEKGETTFVKPSGNQVIVNSSEYNTRQDNLSKQIKETISKPIADVILKNNPKASKAQIDADVDSVNASFKFLRNEISPNVSDVQFSKMVENTMQSIKEDKNTTFSPEAIRMAFYGNAVIKLRETNKEKYYNASMGKEYQQPSAYGNAQFGSALNNRVKDVLAKPEYKNLSHDDALNMVVKHAEEKWDGLKPEVRKEVSLRTPRDANNSNRYRVSPMMQWVLEGGLDK
jgi:lysozyme family protein